MFLIVVDAYSKWPEVIRMSSSTSSETTKVLLSLFSRHGLPDKLVSDNGANLCPMSWRKIKISGFPCCSILKDLTINVSITNVGLILTKLR